MRHFYAQPKTEETIQRWEAARPQEQSDREPREGFSSDLSGRSSFDKLARYIMHFTEPGDIVLSTYNVDGTAGASGALCADKKFLEHLGYQVEEDGVVSREHVIFSRQGYAGPSLDGLDIDEAIHRVVMDDFERQDQEVREWRPFSKIGARHVIMHGGSPLAAIKGQSYFLPMDLKAFYERVMGIIQQLEAQYGHLYRISDDEKMLSEVEWSLILICPECSCEFSYHEHQWKGEKSSGGNFVCPQCQHSTHQRHAKRVGRYPLVDAKDEAKSTEMLDEARRLLAQRLQSPHHIPADVITEQMYTERGLLVLLAFRERIEGSPEDARLARMFAKVLKEASMSMGAPIQTEKNIIGLIAKALRRELNEEPSLSGETLAICAPPAEFATVPDASVDYVVLSEPLSNYSSIRKDYFEIWFGLESDYTPPLDRFDVHHKEVCLPILSEMQRVLKPCRMLSLVLSDRGGTSEFVVSRWKAMLESVGLEYVANVVQDPPRRGVVVLEAFRSLVITARKPV